MTTPTRLANLARRLPGPTHNRNVDRLPQSVLHHLVADIPGPKGETEAARVARFEAQLAEVLSYRPRNGAEAMLATQCMLMRLVGDHARVDAERTCLIPATSKRHLRSARQFDKALANTQRILTRIQSRHLDTSAPATVASAALVTSAGQVTSGGLGCQEQDTSSVRARITEEPEEAFSAVIVPLHPAPKMLQ